MARAGVRRVDQLERWAEPVRRATSPDAVRDMGMPLVTSIIGGALTGQFKRPTAGTRISTDLNCRTAGSAPLRVETLVARHRSSPSTTPTDFLVGCGATIHARRR